MAAPTAGSFGLRLDREIPATPEEVFDAWTEGPKVAQWFCPSDAYTVTVHALDVRVGGGYRIEMKHAGGNTHICFGVYRIVERGRKLAFTWRWEGNAGMPETLVTIVLAPVQAGTHVLLTHEAFDSEAMRAEHEKGWDGCLTRLQRPEQYRAVV